MCGTRSACCGSSTDDAGPAGIGAGSIARAGFTLIELMWAMTLSLVVMGAVASLFGVFTRSLTAAQAAADLSARLRTAAWRLRQDLSGVTVDLMPPVRPESESGYFELFEGPSRDAHAKHGFGGSGLVGDVDDVLMFTTRSEGQPFVGRFGAGTIESPVAEVAWFCRPSTVQPIDGMTLFTLYRRQKLVMPYVGRPPFDGTNSVAAATFDTNLHDLSVRLDGGVLFPNSLGDLTKRENRFLRGEHTAGFTPPTPTPYRLPAPTTFDFVNGWVDSGWRVSHAFDNDSDSIHRNNQGVDTGLSFTYDVPYRITSFIVTSAHDRPEQDPTAYRLQGSNDGSSWQTLSEGALSLPEARKVDSAPVTLPQLPMFSQYRIIFTALRVPGWFVHYADVKFFGYAAPEPVLFRFPFAWATDTSFAAGSLGTPPAGSEFSGQLTREISGAGPNAPLAGVREGDDVILSNIVSFDVRVYDPQARPSAGPSISVVATAGSNRVTYNERYSQGFTFGADGVMGDQYFSWSKSGSACQSPLFPGTVTVVGNNFMNQEVPKTIDLSAQATASGTTGLTFSGTTLQPGDPYWGGPGYVGTGAAYGGYADLAWGGDVKMPLDVYQFSFGRVADIAWTAGYNTIIQPSFFPPAAGAAGAAFPPPGQTAFQSGGLRTWNSGSASALENGLSRTYDTWSTHYEANGVDDDRDGLIDEGTDGVDNNNDGVPDDPGEAETFAPYPVRLRGLEVRIRSYDPASRQIRQTTLRHSFLSR